MTLSVPLQSALTPVIPLGEGAMHVPNARLPAEQRLRGESEDEPFAQVFVRELSKSLVTAAATQPPLSLTGGASSPAVDKDSGDADDPAALSVAQPIPLTEPVFERMADLDEPLDFYQEEAVVSDSLDMSLTSDTVIPDEIASSVVPNPVATFSAWDGAVMRAMASPLSLPLSFDATGKPISSELKADVRRAKNVQDHPSVLEPPTKPPLSLLSPAPSGKPMAINVQGAPIDALLIQMPPSRAEQAPFELIPAEVLPAAPSDVAISVGGARTKEYMQASTVMPSLAKAPVEHTQAAPVSQTVTLLKPVIQDKINVNLSSAPSSPMPQAQPDLYLAASVSAKPTLNKPQLAAKNSAGSVQDWQATDPVTPVVQPKIPLLAEKDQLSAAEYTPILNLQTGGIGRADGPVALPDPQRPDLPRATVQQLVDASVRATERPVELVLNPEDLGRVRISMSMTDASVTLNLGAERSETLELLRRYSEILAQELRDLGYGKISFSFGHHGHGQGGHAQSAEAAKGAADEQLAPVVVHATPRPVQTGLDIRL
jgi:flagellar hook-length control protein FliK